MHKDLDWTPSPGCVGGRLCAANLSKSLFAPSFSPVVICLALTSNAIKMDASLVDLKDVLAEADDLHIQTVDHLQLSRLGKRPVLKVCLLDKS